MLIFGKLNRLVNSATMNLSSFMEIEKTSYCVGSSTNRAEDALGYVSELN